MNIQIKAETLSIAPITATHQLFILKAISKWFDNTPLSISISKGQLSQLLAACYGFKSFEAFELSRKCAFHDTLTPIEPDLIKISQAIEDRLKTLRFKDQNKLFCFIVADYLIKITNNQLALDQVHTQQSLFLHYFINTRSDYIDWGRNPFHLAYWLNEIGHLGCGDTLITDSRLPQLIDFYRRHLHLQQIIFGKIKNKVTQGHTVLMVSPNPQSPIQEDKKLYNFMISREGFPSEISLKLNRKDPHIINFLSQIPYGNPLHSDELQEEHTHNLTKFADNRFLLDAEITKISYFSSALDNLLDISFGNGNNEYFGLTAEYIQQEHAATFYCNETATIKLYGVYDGYSFKHTIRVSFPLLQIIDFSKAPNVKPFELNAEWLEFLGSDYAPSIENSIRIKHGETLLIDDYIYRCNNLDLCDFPESYSLFANSLIKELNKYVFGNKYPIEIAYHHLISKCLNNAKFDQDSHLLPEYLYDIEPSGIESDEADLAPLCDFEGFSRSDTDIFDDALDLMTHEPKPELDIAKPNFKFSQFFKAAKGTSRAELRKFKLLFLSRYQLVFMPFDSTKVPVTIDQNITESLLNAYFGHIKSQGFYPSSREYQQNALDLISDHINHLIHTGTIFIHEYFDLAEGRYRLLATNSKIRSAPQIAGVDVNSGNTSIESPLTAKQLNALFDNAVGTRPIVINKRFRTFQSQYALTCLNTDSNSIEFYALTDKRIQVFYSSLNTAISYFGMLKLTPPKGEALKNMNAWLNAQLEIGNISLPNILSPERYTKFAIVKK